MQLDADDCTQHEGGRVKRSAKGPSLGVATSQRIRTLFHTYPAKPASAGRGLTLRPVHSDPNVYTIEHFLTPAELDHLDGLVEQRAKYFKRSHIDDHDGKNGLDEQRTSDTLVLGKASDSVLRDIERRAADMVCLPADQVEPLQVVSYTDGQRFDLHHDSGVLLESDDGDDTFRVECGVGPRRIVTFFLYLNSLPPKVGATEFSLLPMSVTPRCGTALLFCNVMPDGSPDVRVSHRATPVPAGMRKLGCNLWITNACMLAHTLQSHGQPKKSAARKKRVGVLGQLLADETDYINAPSSSALIGLVFQKRFAGSGTRSGTCMSHDPVRGFTIVFGDGHRRGLQLQGDELLALPLELPESLVKRRVSKYFPGHGRLDGVVRAYDIRSGLYTVAYDDGDQEELSTARLLRVLAPQKKRRNK